MEKKKVCIVGGGAAGMIAAIMAARNHAAITAKIRKFYGMFCKIFLLSRHWTFLRK